MDSTNYGVPKLPYSIFAFYFPYGNGIVEGLALQPYEQLYPTYADYNGYYAVYQIYGNKFVEGPQNTFSLTATPASVTVQQTQTATYQVTLTSIGSFAGTVSLQATGLPAGASALFSPSSSVSLSQGQSVTESLSILTTAATPLGSYNLTISGTSTLPLITQSVSVGLVVTLRPSDFSVAIYPSPLNVATGQCGNLTVTVNSIGTFHSAVSLTLTGLPNHVSGRFTSNPIIPPPGGAVNSVLSICVASSTSPGNYTVLVTAMSSPLVHTASALVSIPGPPPPPPFNALIFWIVIGMLLLALGLGLLVLALSRKGGRGLRRAGVMAAPPVAAPLLVPATGPRVRYVLPMPTVRCRYCGRVMPLQSVYCPYCGKPQVFLSPPSPRLISPRGSGGRNVIAVGLSLISGLLVLLNSAALLVPSFWSLWSAIFFWLPAIGPTYAFILGAMIGLTLVLGAIIMALSSGALADVIMFPFAIFSLMIGGGFIAGMLLGILGGIFALVRRNR